MTSATTSGEDGFAKEAPHRFGAGDLPTDGRDVDDGASGIPAIVVRHNIVREPPNYDPAFVPRIPASKVGEVLADLNNKSAWEALRDRQLDWFAKETS